MFSKTLILCVRTLRTRSRRANPGVQNRLNILSKDTPDINKIELDEELVENLEHDFSNSASFYDEHERSLKKARQKIHFQRIERKYFSPKLSPNFLTWSEKEQIRFLHNSDPGLWTPEKLSQSFPATTDIIEKILRSQWKPSDSKRIKKHDEAVSSNWKAFEDGNLELPSSLERHIKSFISRKDVIKKHLAGALRLKSDETSKMTMGSEFSDILTKYTDTDQSYKKENFKSQKMLNKESPPTKAETYVMGGKGTTNPHSKHFTLEAFRDELKARGSPTTELDEAFLRGSEKTARSDRLSEAVTLSEETTLPTVKVYEPKGIKAFKESPHLVCEDIALKITIPDDKWIEGGIYKVKDCFYDDYGNFLYRVPGLTKE